MIRTVIIFFSGVFINCIFAYGEIKIEILPRH